MDVCVAVIWIFATKKQARMSKMTCGEEVLQMSFSRIIVLLGSTFISISCFGANQIVSHFGDPSICSGSSLLAFYVKTSNQLRQLESNGGSPDAIARTQSALEFAAEGLHPEQYAKYGFTLNVKIDGPKIINLNIPTLQIDNKNYVLAGVTGEDLGEGSSQLKFDKPFSLVKIEFTQLGICSFANPEDNSVGNAEIQAAVDSVLGK